MGDQLEVVVVVVGRRRRRRRRRQLVAAPRAPLVAAVLLPVEAERIPAAVGDHAAAEARQQVLVVLRVAREQRRALGVWRRRRGRRRRCPQVPTLVEGSDPSRSRTQGSAATHDASITPRKGPRPPSEWGPSSSKITPCFFRCRYSRTSSAKVASAPSPLVASAASTGVPVCSGTRPHCTLSVAGNWVPLNHGRGCPSAGPRTRAT